MAKLYFRYDSMCSGKSSALLQTAHNYKERNMEVLLFTPDIDDRFGRGAIKSRIGIESPAIIVDKDFNIFDYVKAVNTKISCILVDEIQFFTIEHINQLSDVVDELNIPVICYGLRADFRTELFPSIQKLFAIADEVEELKTICDCGRKAIINSRSDENGRIEINGNQIEVGDKQYKSVCRRCYKKMIKELEKTSIKDDSINLMDTNIITDDIVDDINFYLPCSDIELLYYGCNVEDVISFLYNNGDKSYHSHDDKGTWYLFKILCKEKTYEMKYYMFDDEYAAHFYVEYIKAIVNENENVEKITDEMVDDCNRIYDIKYKLNYNCNVDELKKFILNNGKKSSSFHDDKGEYRIYRMYGYNYSFVMKYYDSNFTEYINVDECDLPF